MDIIIVVKDGMVQDVYADGHAIISVCDLDTCDPDEYDETATALAKIQNNSDFHSVY